VYPFGPLSITQTPASTTVNPPLDSLLSLDTSEVPPCWDVAATTSLFTPSLMAKRDNTATAAAQLLFS